jgi:hypothetical protein
MRYRMWQVSGIQIDPNWLRLDPIRVLYEFDGPRIFTCRDTPGNLYLAYLCNEDDVALRFLVVPFSAELERELTSGAINVRDALTQHRAWLFDVDHDWQVSIAWEVDIDDIPPGVLPQPGVMLWRHLPSIVWRERPRSYASRTELHSPPLGTHTTPAWGIL